MSVTFLLNICQVCFDFSYCFISVHLNCILEIKLFCFLTVNLYDIHSVISFKLSLLKVFTLFARKICFWKNEDHVSLYFINFKWETIQIQKRLINTQNNILTPNTIYCQRRLNRIYVPQGERHVY